MALIPKLHAYLAQTPNGIKVSITLEELSLKYRLTQVDLATQEQKQPWFLAINPNGRIPALTDDLANGDKVRLFESGSIMEYLVDRYDSGNRISYPAHSKEAIEVRNWLFFQNAGVGPMQGQANHFTRYTSDNIPYAVERYQNETRRLYSVLDKHLRDAGTDYIVGQKCTIADIAHWGWVAPAGWAKVDISAFPALQAWEERVWARESVKKGANVPGPYLMKERLKDAGMTEQYAKETSQWVQDGARS